MHNSHTQPVDAIAELRLRLWARANYEPAEIRRDSQWHPVVLAEMRQKDVDLSLRNGGGDASVSKAVPVVPSLPDRLRLDGAVEAVPAPHAFRNIEMAVPFYA